MRNTLINRKILAFLVGAFMLSGFVLAGQTGLPQVNRQNNRQSDNKPPMARQSQDTTGKKKKVDYITDLNFGVIKKIENDTAIHIVGNVGFHHNGAIIVCDSAVRYDDRRMDCFGNVIINQDSTYIYGDMVRYDGNINIATVHAPLIKITNGTETVMYTRELEFNTETSVGSFSNGGIVYHKDNFMEAQIGTFDGNTNTIKLLIDVSMRSPDYILRTDSLKFNTDTEVTTFIAPTYIWDKDRDFLTSRRGNYDRRSQTYTFTEKAYILTPDQEVWADSIIYLSQTKEAYLNGNVQILDTAQMTLAFGDWAYYNDSLKKAILARKPSIRSWDESKDTSYLRADSIYFETFPRGTTKPSGETVASDETQDSNLDLTKKEAGHFQTVITPRLDSLGNPITDNMGRPTLDTTKVPVKAAEPQFETIAKPIFDSLGNPIFDSLGRPVTEMVRVPTKRPEQTIKSEVTIKPQLDSLGRLILDPLGKPVMDTIEIPLNPKLENPALSDPVKRSSDSTIIKQNDPKESIPTSESEETEESDINPNTPDAITCARQALGTLPMPLDEDGIILLTADTVKKVKRKDKKEKPKIKSSTDSLDRTVSTDSTSIPVDNDSITTIIQSASEMTIKPRVDSLGNPVLDSLGNQLMDTIPHVEPKRLDRKPLLDSLGNPVLDSLGNQIFGPSRAQLLDSLGNPVLDSLGNPIYLDDSTDIVLTKQEKKDSLERLIRAFGHVRSYNKEFQMKCDSLVAYSVDSTSSLFGRPVLWNEENQIIADQIDTYTKDEKIDWADFIGSPFIIQRVDSLRYNQASGRTLQAYFKDNEIDYAHMKGNVMNYYFAQEDDGAVINYMTMQSSELIMRFEKRQMLSITWIGQSDWVMYPIDKIPDDVPQRLEGFEWITDGRANSPYDICTRIERPSERIRTEIIEKPKFYIELSITGSKKIIIEQGTWKDRVDKPIYTIEDFTQEKEFLMQ